MKLELHVAHYVVDGFVVVIATHVAQVFPQAIHLFDYES
jgi:hypothetical protein